MAIDADRASIRRQGKPWYWVAMAARKKPKRPSRKAGKHLERQNKGRQSEQDDACLYLGCFFFDSFGDRDHVGTFQVVIEASSPDDAVKRLRKRLKAIRGLGSILSGTYTIYLEGLVPLTGSFKEGLLVNYESRPDDEPPDYQLLNFMPEQGRPTPRSYRIGKDETKEEPFLDFGGKAHLRVLEAARKLQGEGAATSLPRPSLSAEERERVRTEAAAQKARRVAEAELKKKERLAAAEAKQRRARALEATLAELGRQRR